MARFRSFLGSMPVAIFGIALLFIAFGVHVTDSLIIRRESPVTGSSPWWDWALLIPALVVFLAVARFGGWRERVGDRGSEFDARF